MKKENKESEDKMMREKETEKHGEHYRFDSSDEVFE